MANNRLDSESFEGYLLPLEYGIAVRTVRNQDQRYMLLTRTTVNNPVQDVDIVLLAAATACLQEGPEEAAAELAREELVRDPDRADLHELASQPHSSPDMLRLAVGNYLIHAGYGSDPAAAFRVIGDVYFGRVNRSITHPILGAACVAYFSGMGSRHSEIAAVTNSCTHLFSDWLHGRLDAVELEQEASDLATRWVAN